MKHGVIIPLIGGMAIGAQRALEEAPSWAISWNNFGTNEENFKEYYKGVPFRTLDNENIDNISLNPTIGNHTANAEKDYSSNK